MGIRVFLTCSNNVEIDGPQLTFFPHTYAHQSRNQSNDKKQVHVLPKPQASALLAGGEAELAHLPDDKGQSVGWSVGADRIGSIRICLLVWG